jgi:putative drug exporter of the RND superfamily
MSLGSAPNQVNYYDLRRFEVDEAERLVSENRQSLIIPAPFLLTFYEEVEIGDFMRAVEVISNEEFEIVTAGTLSINERYSQIADEDLFKGELLGLPMAMLVLVAVFGALVAPILPVLMAVFSIGIAFGVVTLLGAMLDLNLFVQNIVTMLGLAVGIDYALFVVGRYREERLIGHSRQRAIERAGATSSKAVVFSGITVVLALANGILIPTNLLQSLGFGAVIVV